MDKELKTDSSAGEVGYNSDDHKIRFIKLEELNFKFLATGLSQQRVAKMVVFRVGYEEENWNKLHWLFFVFYVK